MTASPSPAGAVARQPRPEQRYYRPRGRLVAAWASREREVITDGPAGTGKSRMWLERLYQVATKYPGMRALVVRKTRTSLTESALVTFEQKVLPSGLPWVANQQRAMRQAYHLPNGSEIVVGGLDRPERMFSTEYDLVYVQEASELTESEWEMFLRALRNNVVPYQQLVGDTNPGAPGHWIRRRAASGALRLVPSRHEDNPEYWDQERSAWTEAGARYLAVLDALTGVRYKRLRLGQWVAAENQVYEGWDPAVHLVDRFPIPDEWTRYLAIDFGLTNPFVCQWWAEDHDGRLYRYRELYGTQRLVRDWAHRIHELSRSERIAAVVTDHDVQGRADLEEHLTHGARECGLARHPRRPTTAAYKDVGLGIQHVAQRLAPDRAGLPRLVLLRDALVEADPLLVEGKKPFCTEQEFDSYVWSERQTHSHGPVMLEEPRKADDHGLDALRYMVMYLDDPRRGWARSLGTRAKVV